MLSYIDVSLVSVNKNMKIGHKWFFHSVKISPIFTEIGKDTFLILN